MTVVIAVIGCITGVLSIVFKSIEFFRRPKLIFSPDETCILFYNIGGPKAKNVASFIVKGKLINSSNASLILQSVSTKYHSAKWLPGFDDINSKMAAEDGYISKGEEHGSHHLPVLVEANTTAYLTLHKEQLLSDNQFEQMYKLKAEKADDENRVIGYMQCSFELIYTGRTLTLKNQNVRVEVINENDHFYS